MRSDVIAVGAVKRRFGWWGLSVAASALLTLALLPITTSTASATGTSSTLCSGYQGCAQGNFTTHGYQNASGESYWTMYAGNNCTNYVAYVESTGYEVPSPTYSLGNGGQWAMAASEHGVVVNHTPSVGAVAEWNGGASGMPAAGHVAVVEAVGAGASYIVVSQQHMIGTDGYDWVRIKRASSANQWEEWPTSFIHFPIPATAPIEVAMRTSSVLVRVTPQRFAGYRFDFHRRADQIVKSGKVVRLLDGTYGVSLRSPALRKVFAVRVSVAGRSVKGFSRASRLDSVPRAGFDLSRSAPKSRVVVTISIRRLKAASTTTTTSPTATTTTTTLLSGTP